MDIPAFRRNISNEVNVRWLLRNIHINNMNHPNLDEAKSLLRSELRPQIGE